MAKCVTIKNLLNTIGVKMRFPYRVDHKLRDHGRIQVMAKCPTITKVLNTTGVKMCFPYRVDHKL